MRYSSLALLVACSMATGTAMAQATKITFNGKVTDQTCSVKVDGQEDAKVPLPTVNQNEFTATNPVARNAPFTVEISGCTFAEDQGVKVEFKAANPAPGGFLPNTATTDAAKNVAVRLSKDAAGAELLDLSTPATSFVSLVIPANATSFTHTMAAQYTSIDKTQPVTVGKVTASVEYAVDFL